MQAKQRYVLVIISCAFLILCYFGGYKVKMLSSASESVFGNTTFMTEDELENVITSDYKSKYRERCTMETCFNFSKCHSGFKVYVYPVIQNLQTSLTYQKILNSIFSSKYYTANASEACLFVLRIDTLDRDVLSSDFIQDIERYISALEYWDRGENHIIFNLYSGTWPDYYEDLGFDTGKAILAKASMAESTYRYDFDVSVPLVHKEHLELGGDITNYYSTHLPNMKDFLLAFKGKRYVYGIGSETRNALYHVHNRRDVIAVTTCKHGKSWKDSKDDRCDADNAEYDKYDYDALIQNSSYCLVPRGRRLGSFRLVEVIQYGCIPVILSNGWKLPFFEVIDWTKAAVWGDERLLFQVPELVRSIDPMQAFKMRQTSQLLWHLYFSSMDKIVHTTLEIVRQRVERLLDRTSSVWNSAPGALLTIDGRSPDQLFEPDEKFTAVIMCHTTQLINSISSLYKLVHNIGQSKYAHKIVILWKASVQQPYKRQWPRLKQNVRLEIVTVSDWQPDYRFQKNLPIKTKAVFSFHENVAISTDEIDFAFSVWTSFPARIVGFNSKSHFWNDLKGRWQMTAKWLNEYSLVLLDAALYHTYYMDFYWDWLGENVRKEVREVIGCEEVLLNMLVSHVTRKPPVKVTQRKDFNELSTSSRQGNDSISACFHRLTEKFGYNPLLRSEVRMDPVLYKDQVSNLRKKYKDIELANP